MEVYAIKDLKKIDKIKKLLEQDNKIKELVLFTLGLNTALRISDILKLKWCDVIEDDKKTFKKSVHLQELKTDKYKQFAINDNLKDVLKKLIKAIEINSEDYIFKSNGNNAKNKNKAWSRQYAHDFINRYCSRAGIEGNVGTHTLRKTFGYFAYKNGVDIALLMRIFNHSSQSTTLRYIGIEQDNIDDVYLNLVNL